MSNDFIMKSKEKKNIMKIFPFFVILFISISFAQAWMYTIRSQIAEIVVDNQGNKTIVIFRRNDKNNLVIRFEEDYGINLKAKEIRNGVQLRGNGPNINITLLENISSLALVKISRIVKNTEIALDCIDLNIGITSWYGGPQHFNQYWPVEKHTFVNYSYVTKQQDNVGVAERYWLNSDGAFIYIDDRTPLFINQNSVKSDALCLSAENRLPYNTRRTSSTFEYYIGVSINAKIAQQKAVERFLKKPTAIPDARMVEYPIWSTWARYKAPINTTIVEKFGDEILANKFTHSQLEIDDNWETCYGSLIFDPKTFANPKSLTDRLKKKGFRVTIWVHPFINIGCEPAYSEALRAGYVFFVDICSLCIFVKIISFDSQ